MANVTHYPHRNGPVCGLSPPPNNANAYTVDDPTCPKCADWITKVRASSPAAPAPPAPTRTKPPAPTADK